MEDRPCAIGTCCSGSHYAPAAHFKIPIPLHHERRFDLLFLKAIVESLHRAVAEGRKAGKPYFG